ncbi:hypothetical protein R3W88_001168 [Solanum pinnatisectum]|uniref:Uncharacterized protein n=1 Tax=Solanum pinnatisectum TaxID=50273 RepID=A0AAV9MHC5_9SOLN|nr:hypothetical protein R3W88_001168 [Solanum pinnatisectum]
MSTTRVNVEQRTSISKNRSYNATTSKLNKLEDNSFHVHPCFDEKEDNAPFHQGDEMNQYTLTGDARPAKTSIPVPPNFYPMEDDDTLFQEVEVTLDAQRSDNLQKSPFESRKAKKVFEVAQGSKETKTIIFAGSFEYRKAKKVVEVVQDVEGIETSPENLRVTRLHCEKTKLFILPYQAILTINKIFI